MKAGDLVRFKRYSHHDNRHSQMTVVFDEWRIGLLLEYHTWEKVGTVLYEGNIYRIRAENIQKAGKKDADKTNQ